MPIVHGLSTTVPAGRPLYRITSLAYRSGSRVQHKHVVNGKGGLYRRRGGRYNHPGVQTVYLAEDPLTCLAERMFYFHREALTTLDLFHLTGDFPAFQETRILWEILFRRMFPASST